MRKFVTLLLLFCAAAALSGPHASAQRSLPRPLLESEASEKDLGRILRRYERLRVNAPEAVEKIRRGQRLSFVTSEGALEVELEPSDLLAAGYRAEETGANGSKRRLAPGREVRTYRGRVEGLEGAEARFNLSGDSFEGMIVTPGERFYFERLGKYEEAASEDEFIFYRGSDVLEDAAGHCGVTLGGEVSDGEAAVAPQVAAAVEMAAATLLEADVATEADYEYVTALGGSSVANAEILSIMNLIDGIYEQQLGISLKVVYQHTWASKPAGYPYSSTLEGATLLNEFANHWNANFANVVRDVAHLWTGKDIANNGNSGLAGIAWVGVVCDSPAHSYGVSQRLTNTAVKQALTAHEMGHNFSASHSDGQTGCASTIMSATVSETLSFCGYSRTQIQSHTSTYGSCLRSVTSAPAGLSSVSLAYSSTAGGAPVTGTVTLSAAAPANGAVVTLSDNLSATTLPASVTVPGGKTSQSFTITSTAVTTSQTGGVTASYGGAQKSAPFSVTPGLAVSGKVLKGTAGLGGVTLTLTSSAAGFAARTTTSSSTGTYSFGGLPSGRTYVVTPSSNSYGFTPSSRTLSAITASQTGQNFSAVSRSAFSISGRVLSGTAGLSGRSVVLKSTAAGFTPRTVTSAADGSYSFTNVPGGQNYTVSVSSATYNFTPSSRSYTALAANQTGQNFSVASRKTYAISGRVTRAGTTTALGGVTLTVRNSSGAVVKTTTSAADGTYSLTGITAGYNYTVRPSLTGKTFTPASRSYTNLIANQTGQNYAGSP
ncbi:MAG TPA: M12 family metallo-peptidase [Pyrinomonadaceae bacterium]|nr:M12 family metallo-peptidase [Pyrinomonadaceae bacterium]